MARPHRNGRPHRLRPQSAEVTLLILVDTDVLIWVTRKNSQASTFLDSFDDLAISDVTYMELIQGAKNKREAQAIDKTLKNMAVSRLSINDSI